MDSARELVRSYREIRKDYVFDESIFCDEPEKVHKVKDIVLNRLNEVDRTIILLYADCQSFRKLGKRLGMSHWTVREEVKRIRKTIFEMYDNYDKLH